VVEGSSQATAAAGTRRKIDNVKKSPREPLLMGMAYYIKIGWFVKKNKI
jgi:hypothetical protein